MRCEKKIRGGKEDWITCELHMNNECKDERRTSAGPASCSDTEVEKVSSLTKRNVQSS